MSTWIKCSEKMPCIGQYVLVARGNYVTNSRWVHGWGQNEHKKYWEGCSSLPPSHFSHWMPLPEPPKDNK